MHLGFWSLNTGGMLYLKIASKPIKCIVTQKWPYPSNQSFLGIANYYSQFMHFFAKIAMLLYELFHKDIEWILRIKHTEAMHALQTALFFSSVLCLLGSFKAF